MLTTKADAVTVPQDLEPTVVKADRLLAKGDLEKDDGIANRLTQVSSKITDRVSVAQAFAAARTTSTPEPQPETAPSHLRALPFAELAAHPALLDHGINLQHQLYLHVQMMIDMGIIPEHEYSSYARRFSTISVNTDELTRAPKDWRPQLWVDDMTVGQALNDYLGKTQVTNSDNKWTPIIRNYKKVNPGTKQRLPEAQQLPSGLARLTFSSIISSGKTPDYQLAQQAKGVNHMQPKQWFQMFMEDLNRAMKNLNLYKGKTWKDLKQDEKLSFLQNRAIDQYLPDADTVTQFPEYRNENGRILGMYWGYDYRMIYICGYEPDIPRGGIGVREVLG